MQKLLIASLAAMTAGAAMLSVAATPDENLPVVGAYVQMGFGAQHALPRNFHYGLQLDHDRRFVPAAVAPLMQVNFDRAGLTSAKLNGLDMVARSVVMRQDGSGGDPSAFSTYTMTDWVLVSLGIVGLAGGVAAIANGNDSPQQTETADNGGGGALPDLQLPDLQLPDLQLPDLQLPDLQLPDLQLPDLQLPDLQLPLPNAAPTSRAMGDLRHLNGRERAEYLQWLNGGNGHMGDLVAAP